MVNYMWNLCMPKLEYSHIKFWIQLTSGKGNCVLQRSSGCVVSNTCNAQLKIVLNKWQVRSQNSVLSQTKRYCVLLSTYELLYKQDRVLIIYSDYIHSFSKDTCSEGLITPHLPFVSEEFSALTLNLLCLSNGKADVVSAQQPLSRT